MTCPQLRAALASLFLIGFAACAHPASQPRIVGPVIGESTAPGPSDPTVPPPAPGGVTETSARIHGTPSPVANPAITVDTMPSTLEPSGNSDPNASSAPVVVTPGVVTGSAPVGAATTTGAAAAGPNGPGTGNTTTPTAPAPRPGSAATPPNGPGTGNTVNRAPPATPAAPAPAPVVTPR